MAETKQGANRKPGHNILLRTSAAQTTELYFINFIDNYACMEEIFILIAEDDADDRFLLQAAFEENGFPDELQFVENGVEILDFLTGLKDEAEYPRFILLDLNMPKKDGREVLKELKQHQQLKNIPVVIFSTTNNEQEMRRCYELGANSYITKPNSFESLLKTVAALRSYWTHGSGLPA
jgi:CheY-like chemotaxis protein